MKTSTLLTLAILALSLELYRSNAMELASGNIDLASLASDENYSQNPADLTPLISSPEEEMAPLMSVEANVEQGLLYTPSTAGNILTPLLQTPSAPEFEATGSEPAALETVVVGRKDVVPAEKAVEKVSNKLAKKSEKALKKQSKRKILARHKPLTLDQKMRLAHARELLGRFYSRSIVKSGEKITNVKKFIFEQTRAGLQGKYKKQAAKVADTILRESKRYRFDPIFLMAVIENESTFDPTTLGQFGEIGLMQIKPTTAQWIADKYDLKYKSAKDLLSPVKNIRLGAAYLSYLREHFDYHGRLYLAAYNMGSTNVYRALDKQIWPKDYPSRVMQHYIKYYTELCKPTIIKSARITNPVKEARSSERPAKRTLTATKAEG